MSDGISRRRVLQVGGVGVAGVVVGGAGLSQTGLPWTTGSVGNTTDPSSDPGSGLGQPAVLRSKDGVLNLELVVARTEVEIAGIVGRMLTYNGSVPGPTWILRPGDRLEVRLVNNLDEPTNLHTHGLAVSPEDNGDNPFITIGAGESFDYLFELPKDHPTGVFWYHPHHHGSVADQVFGGLYGAIVVEGDDAVSVSLERVLVISDTTLAPNGAVAQVSHGEVVNGREGELLLVNGQSQPR
ncbi:MAG: multicopper oxidase domain-containing protein, partial [Arachnia sp.]